MLKIFSFIALIFITHFVDEGKKKDFVSDALLKGLMNEQIAQLAVQRSVNLSVRNLAQTIEGDFHTFNEELRRIMKNSHMTVPENLNRKYQKQINKLNRKKGSDFDRTFLKVVMEHAGDYLFELSDMYPRVSDNDLKIWMEKMLYRADYHLERAVGIKNHIE